MAFHIRYNNLAENKIAAEIEGNDGINLRLNMLSSINFWSQYTFYAVWLIQIDMVALMEI